MQFLVGGELMEYKEIRISDRVSIPVPIGLSPDEEAKFIINRIGFVDFEKLEAEILQAMKDNAEGKLADFQSAVEAFRAETRSTNGAKK
jgi:hypothetical protein